MCLAVPGRITEVWEEQGTRMATVDFGGVTKDVCLEFTPEVTVGDYVIVHAGFAISRVDEAAAIESLRPLVSREGQVTANRAGNAVIVADYADNVARVRERLGLGVAAFFDEGLEERVRGALVRRVGGCDSW